MSNNISTNPKLTILIPTRNRAQFLDKSLKRIVRSINFAEVKEGEVEVIIVDNHSQDETVEVVKKWSDRCDFIKSFKHEEPYHSAEESLFHGMKYCKGDYIWSFGDDDYMTYDAVSAMFSLIKKNVYDLIVTNFRLCFLDDPISEQRLPSYVPALKEQCDSIVEYKTYNLFKDFGFWHVTAGFSLCCFRREKFKIDSFAELMAISRIYSYSSAIFLSFCKGKAAFILKPLSCMTINKKEDEFTRISEIAESGGNLPYYSWSNGFLKLISELSVRTKIPLSFFLSCRELIFIRDSKINVIRCVADSMIANLVSNINYFCSTNITGFRTYLGYLQSLVSDYKNILIKNDCAKNFSPKFRKLFKKLEVIFYYCPSFLLKRRLKIIAKKIESKSRFMYDNNEYNSKIGPDPIVLGRGITLNYGKIKKIK